MRIAIQGGQASFHDMATQQYFTGRQVEILACQTFRQLCNQLLEKEADFAVMAIENSLVGSILPNYALLQEYPFFIIGETYLHIQQNLMALPGQSLADIQYIRSHPMALHQCSEFLESHPEIRVIETTDTAESAREIREKGMKGVAAIASKIAAERYELEIVAQEIENLKQNYTRFLVLSRRAENNGMVPDKASINFLLKHQVGALAEVLDIFRKFRINLTLIQSIPLLGHPNQYAFHVDLEWLEQEAFEQSLSVIRHFSKEVRVLGIYPKGALPYDYPGGRAA
jgi:prephenate dehydratase